MLVFRPKCTTYSISKAAVNMLTVHQSEQLKDRGIKVICMDPGWVKTRMGGEGAILEPHVSIGGVSPFPSTMLLHGCGALGFRRVLDVWLTDSCRC